MSQPIIKLCKCLYNAGYCEFNISQVCRDKYKELYNETLDEYVEGERMNNNLIKVIELLGIDKCNGPRESTRLAITLLPEELIDYVTIDDYDGRETVYINYNEAYSELLANIMKEGIISDIIIKLNMRDSVILERCSIVIILPIHQYFYYNI